MYMVTQLLCFRSVCVAKPPPPKETQFKPGQSGNPKGRPPSKKVKKAIRHLGEHALASLEQSILAGEQWGTTLWFHYFYGKPVDQLQLTGAEGKPLFDSLSDEQLEARFRAIVAKTAEAAEPE